MSSFAADDREGQARLAAFVEGLQQLGGSMTFANTIGKLRV
jgi:hypothetical protein